MEQLERDAEEVLAEVLRSDVASVESVHKARMEQADLEVTLRDGTVLFVAVKTAAHPSPDQVARLTNGFRRGATNVSILPVLVADVLSLPARHCLAQAGWGFFDRRGHLYIREGPRLVELTVAPRAREPVSQSRAGIRGASGLAVAFAHLLEPDSILGVRELARASRLHSPTSVTNARRALEKANLLEPDGRAVVPDLFWALAATWARPLHGLSSLVTPALLAEYGLNTNGPYFHTLRDLAGKDSEPAALEGVGVGGDLAAELYGAPVVRTSESPFDLYVPGEVVISRLKRRCGEPRHLTERVVGLRPFPAGLVARTRFAPRNGSQGFPVVHPLVVALDLAQDPARGAEVLAEFEPAEFRRVW